MIFMEELGLCRAIFEGDSETVVKALLGDWPDRSCIGHIVKDCKSLMGCFQTCSFSHVRRQSNGVAHALTRRARKSSPLFVWMESVPPDISYLGYVWIGRKTHVLRLAFFLFFLQAFVSLRLLFMHCAWTVAAKFDFSPSSQPIRTYHALFTDPQISLFSNFLIKNGSHGTTHTFKNYFATVFFSFQFLTVSKRTLSICWCNNLNF